VGTNNFNFYHDEPLFGLDIGHSSMKVMQLDRNHGQLPKVLGYGVSNYYHNEAINNGVIVDYAALGKAAFGYNSASFVINPLNQAELPIRLMTAFKMAFIYIQKIIFPANLSATHAYNHLELVTNPIQGPEFFLGILSLAILLFLIFYKKTKLTPVGIGALIFIIPYFMVSRFVFTGGELLAERWMYFPSIGLAAMWGFLIEGIYKKNNFIAWAILGVILLLSTAVIFPRNKVWLSNEALYKSMIADAPNSAQAHYTLAQEYLNQGRIESAGKHIDQALKIYSKYPAAINLASAISLKEGNAQEAEKLLLYSLTLNPLLAKTHLALGGLYYSQQDYQKALSYFEKNIAFSYRVNNEEMLFYAAALAKLGRYEQSIDVLEKLTAQKYVTDRLERILAFNYYKLGKLDQARKIVGWPDASENQLASLEKSF